MKHSGNFKDIIGQKFNRLTVIKFDKTVKGVAWFLCRCDCGTEKSIRSRNIREGQVKSCGCYHDEYDLYINRTHQMSTSAEYSIWAGIKQRCFDISSPAYHHYGGRGITMCDKWKDSFENFLVDMGTRASPKHTIERIDNDGPYSPENCKWATMKEQANNRRNSRIITCHNKSQTVTQWAEELNLKPATLWHRVFIAEIPVPEALTPGRLPKRKSTS